MRESSRILEYIDQSVNPCDDFYGFACGGFDKYSSIYPEQDQVNSFTVPNARISSRLYQILSNDSIVDEPKPYRLAKALFRGCNNVEMVMSRGLEPLRELLNKFGGWPVVTGVQWNETAWTWQSMLKGYRNAGAPWHHLFRLNYAPVFFYNVGM